MDGLFTIVIAAVVGRLCWSPLGYAIHGLLSHRFRTLVTPLHWGHHRMPAAVFTSPLAWIPTAGALFALAVGLSGVALGAAFSLGLLVGFLRYELVHWRIHFCVPRSAHERRLRDHPLAQHFVDPRAYHGVTSHVWDHVFGTLPATRETDYQRGSRFPPIGEPSNLRASWSPVATVRAVRQVLAPSAGSDRET